MNPEETFENINDNHREKNDKIINLNFDSFRGPKWPNIFGASEAHIPHKSTCNDHVKQYWCETSENFLRNWPKTRIMTPLKAQNLPHKWASEAHIAHIPEDNTNEHIRQDWRESKGHFFYKKKPNPWILIHLEAQNGPKI